ncbi:MAG: hypothetical protein A2X24_04925 [Chloroflexi bacterium GWB2_54_36]|nr:MAG: hypothetical protein A2X24_04925 [Chloroflexi bacterium GWB2_54_36]
MATWICHLRVSERIAAAVPGLDKTAFHTGSLAPDSGIPNDTWTEFNPPKEVTHFLVKGEGNETIHDLDFYRAYLEKRFGGLLDAESSFLWGYFFHLVTDILWVDLVWTPTKLMYADMIAEIGKLAVVDRVKRDWYDLDHRFLRDHPSWEPWQRILSLELTGIPISHIPLSAVTAQLDLIRTYYTDPEPGRVLERPFPYLNEATMQRAVTDCAAACLKLYLRLQAGARLDGAFSATSWLSAAERQAYSAPLGDIVV